MKKLLLLALAVCLVLAGCGGEKAASSREAIQTAKAMETTQEKMDYLIGQAKTFYSSKEFQQAIDVAQYVLQYLDKDSQEAKDLLEKAKDQLAALAEGAMEDAKKGLEDFGK